MFLDLCQFYDNFMILLICLNFMVIYVKNLFYGQTDRRTTKNYSVEAHKKKKNVFYQDRQTHFQLKTIVRNLTIITCFY